LTLSLLFVPGAELSEAELALHTIGIRMKTTADRVFDVLEVIHEFEPTGVGARNLAVIVDQDAVMVCDLESGHQVRAAIDRVSAGGR
jgi:hypothetical protein